MEARPRKCMGKERASSTWLVGTRGGAEVSVPYWVPFFGGDIPRSKLSTLFDFSTQPQKTLDLKSVWASSAKAVRGSAWLTLAVGMLGLPKTG